MCFESRLPQRAVAKSLGLSQGAISGYLSRARAAGIAWPLAGDLDDARLEALRALYDQLDRPALEPPDV